MAAIDTYIGFLSKFQASAIILEGGKQIVVRLATGDRSATQSLTPAQIHQMVEEVAPPEAMTELLVGGTASFDYRRGPQPVRFTVTSRGSAVRLVIAIPDTTETVALPPTRPTPSPIPAAPPPAVTAAGGLKLDAMLRAMREMGASDLHMSCTMPPLVRKDGEMKPVPGFPVLTPELMLQLLYEICPEKNRKEFEERSDTDFAYAIEGLSRFRANMFRDRHGPGGVFRAIPFTILTPDKLGLPQKVLELCYLTKGLVVVTGPTGSGKSTTLATLIDHINQNRSDHIITIEDPIEFVHDNKRCLVNQREVHVHTRSFKDALRAALREDPDIVLVGEMRDLETVAIAVETAETGHLVFGTLHTTTAPSTVDRIIDQCPADRQEQIRTMLAGSLRGVVSQTLCKRIGGGRAAAGAAAR